MGEDGEVSSPPTPFERHEEQVEHDAISPLRVELLGDEEEDDGRALEGGEGVSASLLEPRVPLQLGPTAGPSPPPHSEVNQTASLSSRVTVKTCMSALNYFR